MKTKIDSSSHSEVRVSEQLRDELAVQAHLFTLEVKQEWEGLEHRFHELQQMLSSNGELRKIGKESVLKNADKVAQTLISAYRKIQARLHLNTKERHA